MYYLITATPAEDCLNLIRTVTHDLTRIAAGIGGKAAGQRLPLWTDNLDRIAPFECALDSPHPGGQKGAACLKRTDRPGIDKERPQ